MFKFCISLVNGVGTLQGSDVTSLNDSSASGTLRMMTAALNTTNERPPQDPIVIQQQQQVSKFQKSINQICFHNVIGLNNAETLFIHNIDVRTKAPATSPAGPTATTTSTNSKRKYTPSWISTEPTSARIDSISIGIEGACKCSPK